LEYLEAELKREFIIKNLGKLSFYLGWKIKINDGTARITQESYREKVLKRFQNYRYGKGRSPISKILNGNEPGDVDYPFQRILGSLMYLATSTRPDLTFSISFLSRVMKNPQKDDEKMLNGVLMYLEKNGNLGLEYKRMDGLNKDEVEITIYCDSDWAGDKKECASTSGYLCFLNGNLISWRSKKQDRTAQSSTEAEYIALFHGIQEAIWVKQLLEELEFKVKGGSVKIYQDNKGAINLAENAVYSPRTKHVDIKYHFIRQAVARGEVKLEYVGTENMKADGLTKAVNGGRLKELLFGVDLKEAS
jgi:hypothetical protein